MDTQTPGPSGLLGSLRGLVDGLIGSVHDRIELFGLELQEEKLRLVQLLLWTSAAIVLGLLTVIGASIALIVWFWDTARVAVATGLALAYLAGFMAVVAGFRRFLQRQPQPFEATLRELRDDRGTLRDEP